MRVVPEAYADTRLPMKKLARILLAPFGKGAWLWLWLMLLQLAVLWFYAIADGVAGGVYGLLVYLLCSTYYAVLLAWAVTLVACLLTKCSRVAAKIWIAIASAVTMMFGIVDICCHEMLGTALNQEFITVFAETNPGEAGEFMSTYGSWRAIVAVLGFTAFWIVSGCLLWRRRDSLVKLADAKWLRFVCALLLIISGIGSLRHYKYAEGDYTDAWLTSVARRVADVAGYRRAPEIEGCPTTRVMRVESSRPERIVIIIGESLSKTHMGLYGYRRDTTPGLSALADSGMVVFGDAMSPGYITLEAFKRFMTDWDGVHGSWTTSNNIVDVARAAGYRVLWLSNQNNRGLWDNIPARFANRSDSVVWMGDQLLGPERKDVDGELLPFAASDAAGVGEGMTFVHLNGSHPRFSDRYPRSFERFCASEYSDFPEALRNDMADYDNSVLYNDHVVATIMNYYAGRDAVVIYFSDHSLQLGETSTGLVGHALDSNPDEVKDMCRRVPMMVYMTSGFVDRHSAMKSAVDSLAARHFSTDNLLEMVTTLMGVRLEKAR